MEADVKKTAPYEESDIFGTIKADEALEGIGDILRPRREAANITSNALYEANRACPPYMPFAPPKLTDAPWAL